MSDLGISSSMSSASSTPTGMTGAGGGNRLRITGLNTGLDVDSIVKKMLKGEQTKIDEVKSQEQTLSWKQDEYNSIIKEVRDLQSSYFDIANLSNDVMSPDNYSPFTVNYTGTSGSVTATAYTGAKTGNYTVSFTGPNSGDEVGQLASAATITCGSIGTSKSFTSSVWDNNAQKINIGFSVNGGSSNSANGGYDSTISFNGLSAGSTISDVVNSINTAIDAPTSKLAGKVEAIVTTSNNNSYIQFEAFGDDKIGIESATTVTNATPNVTTQIDDLSNLIGKVINPSDTNTLADIGMADSSDTFYITYDGTTKPITVRNTDTISSMIENISNATGGSVDVNFSQLTGKFTINTDSTGKAQTVEISTTDPDSSNPPVAPNPTSPASGSFLDAIKVNDQANASGQDAIVYITSPGGTPVKVEEAKNNFNIDGINYSLNSKVDSSFTVGTDTTKVHDMITNFIAKYNTVVGDIQDQLNQEKDYKYPPLTDAQKSSMSQTDITNWETKAKQGILRNDSNLQNILNNLESAFTSPVVDSNNNNLTSVYFGTYGPNAIGIDSSLTSQDEGGGTAGKTSSNNVLIFKIGITNDQKLTDAISQHPDQILKLFTNTSTETDSTKKFNESGIFERIDNILTDNVGMVESDSTSAIRTKDANNQDSYSQFGDVGDNTLPDQIYNQEVQLKNLDTEYNDLEDKYYNQFTQLEVAEEKFSSESSILSGLSGSSS